MNLRISGRASSRPHQHVSPQLEWISCWIEKGEEDLPVLIELFRLRYEQLISRGNGLLKDIWQCASPNRTEKGPVNFMGPELAR